MARNAMRLAVAATYIHAVGGWVCRVTTLGCSSVLYQSPVCRTREQSIAEAAVWWHSRSWGDR